MTQEIKQFPAVLIVEDEDDHYELILRGFEQQAKTAPSFRIKHAKTLAEAFRVLHTQEPDIILSDWKLPDGEGIELIRKDEAGEAISPVMIMTSHGNEAWAVEAMRAGAVDYIVKSPAMLSEMARLTERALREWEGRQERKRLEAQLRQAQKMEAVGHLAGGIAHDFNNILTAIIGYANLLSIQVGSSSELNQYIDPIVSSAERAAELTRQILAFSRKQVLSKKETELNRLIRGAQKLLLRVLVEDIDFKVRLIDQDLPVLVDPGQIEQVIMNLCTNARDAMPSGGVLSLSTAITGLDQHDASLRGLEKAGRYATITVSDTGKGMDSQTSQRIFEPFFTTKEVGKGTGLGLSIVYGIIKQHNGQVSVASEPDTGTTFTIYLPLLKTWQGSTTGTSQTASRSRGGSETILIAEDNPDTRQLTKHILEQFGYTVITAEDGEEAITRFDAGKDAIQLVILDVVMPKKSGKEVHDAIKRMRPGVKVLFVSGYTADIVSSKGIVDEGGYFLAKPFSLHELLAKIREILTPDASGQHNSHRQTQSR